MISFKVLNDNEPIHLVDDVMELFSSQGPRAMDDASDEFLDEVRSELMLSVDAEVGPDESPTMRTGDLAQSFRKLPLWKFPEVIVGGVYSDDPGASRLEWGRVDIRGIRTFPHPYLTRAARRVEEKVDRAFDDVVTDE